jgi:hypothetical protein
MAINFLKTRSGNLRVTAVTPDEPLPVVLSAGIAAAPSIGGLAELGAGRLSGTVTIANGASLSDGIDLGSSALAGILMPAAWTAAGLSFAVSTSLAGTYVPLWNSFGAEYIIASASAVASQHIVIPLVDFAGIQFIKVRSGTAAAAVNQGAARILTLITVP